MPSRMSISVNLCRWRQSNQKQQRLLLCFCYNAASGPTATLYSQATQALNHIDGLLGWKSRVLSCQFVEYNGDGRWERTQRQTDRGRNTVERSIYWHNNDSSQLVLYLVTVFYWLLPNVLLTEEGAKYTSVLAVVLSTITTCTCLSNWSIYIRSDMPIWE